MQNVLRGTASFSVWIQGSESPSSCEYHWLDLKCFDFAFCSPTTSCESISLLYAKFILSEGIFKPSQCILKPLCQMLRSSLEGPGGRDARELRMIGNCGEELSGMRNSTRL